ncbi:MAG: hypothetical protein KGL02_11115 [Acidobacteriota bacterium]|nr:hypothetical protein [Acidobacteriota bacterium]
MRCASVRVPSMNVSIANAALVTAAMVAASAPVAVRTRSADSSLPHFSRAHIGRGCSL